MIMKTKWIALLSACLTMPIAFGQGGQNQIQNQKRFGDGTGLPAYLDHYDCNKDGVIDEEERQVMDQARDQIRKQLRTDWDVDGDGKISDKEREQARTRLRDMITECRVTRFTEADGDGDGELSYAEFKLLPGMAKKLDMEGGEAIVTAIFDRLDADPKNGTISLDEFLAAVKQCDRDRVSG